MADFDESDIPKEVPASEDPEKDPENVIRGHKANLSNPNTSAKVKAHSRQILQAYDEPTRASEAPSVSTQNKSGLVEGGKNPENVTRGLKASIHNPGVSEGVKKQAQEKFDVME